MKLIYRGISYPLQSNTIATRLTKTQGKYRGVSYGICSTENVAVSLPKNLVYRGVRYIDRPLNHLRLNPTLG